MNIESATLQSVLSKRPHTPSYALISNTHAAPKTFYFTFNINIYIKKIKI
ncbi:hypothetical protein N474_01235 [Pseudoalteromonas luteoviolacea CPMOR-2]|uniref:Uncharacterized protein n=1 Tax=Pseudoalteromonas luteoviolacea DSM 6061 TaxID=1365250 RepID=A0A161ZY75_9GAMM|nr:hypothetical protein N475_16100 [Pseudoalteromonas luteoviolacea DSM 6061]KZN54364.1 hypothetical protein N474_01235 [Pseudoalteromonas luteoviolacea CPMOR-2]MBE0388822.1 hypothetical protein [Pseudoalteromonas luteoviolacea DSM 6061]